MTDSIKSLDLYFIGNKKIYLLFHNDEDIDEIGFINDEGIFIPEFIMEYQGKKLGNNLDNLNNFFKKDFYEFYLDKKIDSCGIKNKHNKTIGHCFKLLVKEGNKIQEVQMTSYNIIGFKEIKKEIEFLINIIIDMKKIILKLKKPLNKDCKIEKYFPLNKQWFNEYIQHYDFDILFKDKIINETLDKIINSSTDILSNKEVFLNSSTKKEFTNIINNYSNNLKSVNFKSNLSLVPSKIDINCINQIFYYSNFILISEETKKLLFNNDSKNFYFYCLFGESKIFVVNNGPQKFLINAYYLDSNNNILPEIFYKFNKNKELSYCLSLLKEKGYHKFINYHLLFNDDLTSPIFNENNKEIGYAFKYSPSIKDYSPYIINNEYKTMVKLFIHYLKLHSKSIMYNSGKNYILVNSQYTKLYKDYYDYSILEQELSKNKIVVAENIKNNYEDVVNDKIITLIIKNLPNGFNKKFHEKSKFSVQIENIIEEPYIKNVENTNLFYYDDFELISSELYSLLFKKNNLGLNGKCYFINNDICIKTSKDLNNEYNSAIFIYGYLNSHQNFKANYLLEYNTEKDFINNINDLNTKGGFDLYINSFIFNNNVEQLTDINNNPIGLIYNLNMQNNQKPYTNPNFNSFPEFQPKPNFVPNYVQHNNPPLIGLKNIGATCYMNSVLQCLSQIEPLANYFKSSNHVNNTIIKYKKEEKDCLTESFKILIDNLWPDNYHNLSNNYYAPYDFKNKISKMNPLFQGVHTNDAKDLVNFIIMTLHDELNEKKKQNSINYSILGDQKNEDYMLNWFMEYFNGENKSIISDLFYAVTHTMTKCLNCQINKHNYEVYFFLIFPLEEVRKYKLQEIIELNQNLMKIDMNTTDMNKIQNNLSKIKLLQNNSVDILDCFDYNQKIENFIGEIAMYCDTCKDQKPAEYQTKIYYGPKFLILILNRGFGNKFKVKLQFSLELDLTNYLENKTSGCIYDLIGVVSHKGENGANGHFIASCKSPVDNNWYQYNDDLVNPIKNFKEEILDFAMPYILFYKNRKIENED